MSQAEENSQASLFLTGGGGSNSAFSHKLSGKKKVGMVVIIFL